MAPNSISDEYKKDFLAHVCETVKPDLHQISKEQEGITYFLKRLTSIEEKAQADGLSQESLFEILSYDPHIEEEIND